MTKRMYKYHVESVCGNVFTYFDNYEDCIVEYVINWFLDNPQRIIPNCLSIQDNSTCERIALITITATVIVIVRPATHAIEVRSRVFGGAVAQDNHDYEGGW